MRTFGTIFRKCARAAAIVPALMIFFPAWVPPCRAFQQSTPAPQSDQAEMTSHETSPTFQLKTERNLVVVRAVVRDSKGNARGDLRQEDFRLADNGKPQTILHFSVENPKSTETASAAPGPEADSGDPGEGVPKAGLHPPRRFLAIYFDDINLRNEDAMRVKLAAMKYITSGLLPGDQVGVFTSSERVEQDFTDDQAKIGAAISQVISRPIVSNPEDSCPEIFDYQAYLIVEAHDQFAMDIATEEYFDCNCQAFLDNPRVAAQCRMEGASSVMSTAEEALQVFETNTQASLRSLQHLVRRLAAYPGQRTILMVSPGFLTRTFESQLDEIADRALHSNITINALDAKGLYAPLPGGNDVTRRPVVTPTRPDLTGRKEQYRLDSFQAADDTLASLSADTGGFFFHNNNDLYEGFQRAGELPEIYYVLVFSPSNLKQDGRFHSLKVSLAQPAGLSVQARRGYFAKNKSTDPAVQASEEIQDAVFSPDELNELPIDVHTQYFRLNESTAKLSVMTHVDLRFVHFQKREGKNFDKLTLVTALFDANGKYITAMEKTLELRLLDATLTRLTPSGITLKTSFDVKPGRYLVRQVVRDVEGSELSGISRSVQIPF